MRIDESLTEEEKKQRRDNLIINCLVSEGDIVQSRERMLLDYLSDAVNMRLSRMQSIFSSMVTSNAFLDYFNIPDKKNLISLYEFIESFYHCYQSFKEEFDKLPKIESIILFGLISRYVTDYKVGIRGEKNPDIESYIALFEKYQPLFETYRTLHNNPIVCHKKNCTLQIKIVVRDGIITNGLDGMEIVLDDDLESEDSCKLVAHIDLSDGIKIVEDKSKIRNGKAVLKRVTEQTLKEMLFNKVRLGKYTLDTFEANKGFTKGIRDNAG